MELTALTARELGKKIQSREVKVMEAVEAYAGQIERLEPCLHSYITVNIEEAIKQAEKIQDKILKGELTQPLAGVPMALKDNICTKGVRTTCGSKMLDNFVPPYSATVAERLERAGAILLGKTNMDEFAMGSSTETSFYGSTKNPWNLACVPGGSSGGSAAAVAAYEAAYALGSDTGGSIRQPSAFCGVVGLKPTYGTVSRYGLVAYASSLDQIGPVARDVRDVELVFNTIKGVDEKDSTSVKTPGNEGKVSFQGMRIGIPEEYFKDASGNAIAEDIRRNMEQSMELLRSLGAEVELCHFKALDYAIPAYYTIALAEASSNLSRYDGVKFGYRAEEYANLEEMLVRSRTEAFGEEVKRRILLGTYVLSAGHYDAYYLKALKARKMIKQEWERLFETYDVILGPTAPTTAFDLGEGMKNPMQMYLGDLYTVSVNLAGLPAISVPSGLDERGLPIGVQMIGRPFEEHTIIELAAAFEEMRGRLIWKDSTRQS